MATPGVRINTHLDYGIICSTVVLLFVIYMGCTTIYFLLYQPTGKRKNNYSGVC